MHAWNVQPESILLQLKLTRACRVQVILLLLVSLVRHLQASVFAILATQDPTADRAWRAPSIRSKRAQARQHACHVLLQMGSQLLESEAYHVTSRHKRAMQDKKLHGTFFNTHELTQEVLIWLERGGFPVQT